VAILDLDFGLRVFAVLAEDELGDEAVQGVLELGGFVGAVDDPAVIGSAIIGLSAKFETEVFDDV
jgi:hypothetical protein